ncbi:MAG TPA: hypothetical protein VF749_18105, partial [Candidatus Acidoferrum sp.]
EGENAKVRYFWRTYIQVCREHPRFAETASIFTSRDKPETRLLERDVVTIRVLGFVCFLLEDCCA